TVKVDCAQRADINSSEFVSENIRAVFQLAFEQIKKTQHLLFTVLTPFRKSFHSVLEIASGVLECHASRQHKVKVHPAQPLFNDCLFHGCVSQQWCCIRVLFLKVTTDGHAFGDACAIIELQHRHFF